MSIRLRATALTVLLLLPGGCLTRALWEWSDPDAVPDLDTAQTVCAVEELLAPPHTDPIDPALYAVAFVPRAGGHPPPHLAAQAREGTAWLVVRPWGDVPAARTIDGFRPRAQDLDVFDGRHLRRATNNVRMTIYGTAPRAAIGELVPEAAVPTALRDAALPRDAVAPFGPVRTALDGLDAHDWIALLAPPGPLPTSGPAEPVWFVDRAGRAVASDELHDLLLRPADDPAAARAAGVSLLARVERRDGERTFVRIPVPVLLNARALELHRDGDLVAFAWARRGTGRFVRGDAVREDLVPFPLPATDGDLVYEWSTEVPAESGWKTPIQALLTPFTWLFDFLIESNPALRALRDALFPPPPPPVRPQRGSR